jgi:hypothetical protein|tara:strand:+ start:91 stop:282 length:192 start_codon:yes stop_codon:yes gene_type:complete
MNVTLPYKTEMLAVLIVFVKVIHVKQDAAIQTVIRLTYMYFNVIVTVIPKVAALAIFLLALAV